LSASWHCGTIGGSESEDEKLGLRERERRFGIAPEGKEGSGKSDILRNAPSCPRTPGVYTHVKHLERESVTINLYHNVLGLQSGSKYYGRHWSYGSRRRWERKRQQTWGAARSPLVVVGDLWYRKVERD